jgi:hypothetical protein
MILIDCEFFREWNLMTATQVNIEREARIEDYAVVTASLRSALCRVLGQEVTDLLFQQAVRKAHKNYPVVSEENICRILSGGFITETSTDESRRSVAQGLCAVTAALLEQVRGVTGDVLWPELWEQTCHNEDFHPAVISEIQWPVNTVAVSSAKC